MNSASKRRAKASNAFPKPSNIYQSIKANFIKHNEELK